MPKLQHHIPTEIGGWQKQWDEDLGLRGGESREVTESSNIPRASQQRDGKEFPISKICQLG